MTTNKETHMSVYCDACWSCHHWGWIVNVRRVSIYGHRTWTDVKTQPPRKSTRRGLQQNEDKVTRPLTRRITNDLSVKVNSGIIVCLFGLHNCVVASSRQTHLVNSTYKIQHQATNKLLVGEGEKKVTVPLWNQTRTITKVNLEFKFLISRTRVTVTRWLS